jgi:hypothetical protein
MQGLRARGLCLVGHAPRFDVSTQDFYDDSLPLVAGRLSSRTRDTDVRQARVLSTSLPWPRGSC